MIYQATLKDIDAINRIVDDISDYEDREENIRWSIFKKGFYPDQELLAYYLTKSFFFVLEDEKGEKCACLACDYEEPEEYEGLPWTPGKAIVIHLVLVHPDHYGKGYGSALIQHTLDFAKTEGCVSVKIDTGGQNKPAQRLYSEKMKFATIANIPMMVAGLIPHKEDFFYVLVL